MGIILSDDHVLVNELEFKSNIIQIDENNCITIDCIVKYSFHPDIRDKCLKALKEQHRNTSIIYHYDKIIYGLYIRHPMTTERYIASVMLYDFFNNTYYIEKKSTS